MVFIISCMVFIVGSSFTTSWLTPWQKLKEQLSLRVPSNKFNEIGRNKHVWNKDRDKVRDEVWEEDRRDRLRNDIREALLDIDWLLSMESMHATL